MSRAKVWFFDLDGTLADTDADIRLAWRSALAAMGVDTEPFDRLFVAGPTLEEMARRMYPSIYSDAFAGELRRRFGECYDRCGFPQTREYPGVLAAVRKLRASGIRTFIATNKRFAGAKAVARRLGWEDAFEAIYAGDMRADASGTGKMRKDALLAYAMSKIGAAAGECTMVGDTSGDFNAAKANGMRSIGVTWGYGTAEELRQADSVVSGAAELLAGVEA